ncbi:MULTISPECIES: efflux RND transporter periplasmic adaptor subunit [Nostoc]|uniref:Efflux RND transporter periplasmic adaptor subunit n=1 Tax=Nostoc paludosum FACHB-159 TaxID=2692908 RepID=A0ABR8KDM1_9NOSO|nr:MULTISPECIES: efflux RND transporter periplasmic adaptor subunit [Nostoc]MBD2681178.1 efflux RND transporter periplasmic adaptor subunit [Nostoc sp. FACHB-857]MBD2737645.1 efflux RND transporter periplasmic adaptor subunit [Nostoc paludosum FACHB-159]
MDTQENTKIADSDLTATAPKNQKNRLSSITIIATTTFVVSGLLALGIIPRIQQQSELNAFAKSTSKKVSSVNVVKPKLAANFTELVLPSSIQAGQETTIYARTSGYLQKKLVDIGDRVNKGQLLAVIDAPETDQDVEQARAELAKSEANIAQVQADLAQKLSNLSQTKANFKARQAELIEARTNLELARQTWQRWQLLQKQGAVTTQAADERESAYYASQANVETLIARVNSEQESINTALAAINSQKANINAFVASKNAAQSNLQRIKVLQSFKQIVAPFSGVITARNIDTGALISAGSNSNSGNSWLFKVAQTNNLRIRINVPQAFMQSIQPGQTALVRVRELPKKAFSGKVIRTADALDPSSNTLLTEIEVRNSENVLRPGMYAEVTFKAQRVNPPLLVPANTLVINADGIQVATVTKENKVNYKKVELGRDYGTEVEVISGLSPNARLITNPTDALQEGKSVQVLASKPKTKN